MSGVIEARRNDAAGATNAQTKEIRRLCAAAVARGRRTSAGLVLNAREIFTCKSCDSVDECDGVLKYIVSDGDNCRTRHYFFIVVNESFRSFSIKKVKLFSEYT